MEPEQDLGLWLPVCCSFRGFDRPTVKNCYIFLWSQNKKPWHVMENNSNTQFHVRTSFIYYNCFSFFLSAGPWDLPLCIWSFGDWYFGRFQASGLAMRSQFLCSPFTPPLHKPTKRRVFTQHSVVTQHSWQHLAPTPGIIGPSGFCYTSFLALDKVLHWRSP